MGLNSVHHRYQCGDAPSIASYSPTHQHSVPSRPHLLDDSVPPASADPPLYDSSRLQSLIMSKEKELHDINQFRIHTLESLLKDRERALKENNDKIQGLKADFQYNLQLIEERDAELDRADATVAKLEDTVRAQAHESEALRQALAEAEQGSKRQAARIAADMEAAFARREQEMGQAAAEQGCKQEEELSRQHRAHIEALRQEWESEWLAKEEAWRERVDRLGEERSRMERERAARERAVARGVGLEAALQEQRGKFSALAAENKELRAHMHRLAARHEERMEELLRTLRAAETALEESQREAVAANASKERVHEQAIREAVHKGEMRLSAAKDEVARAEERAGRADQALREVRREMEERMAVRLREEDAREGLHAQEVERKEALLVKMKSQLWESEAEGRELTMRVGDLGKRIEEKERELVRTREQLEQFRTFLIEERQESERRAAEEGQGRHPGGKTVEVEDLKAELRASQREASTLRARVAGLEDVARRPTPKGNERAARQQEAVLDDTLAARRTASLVEEGALVQENVRLRTIISDMRHEMERLKLADKGGRARSGQSRGQGGDREDHATAAGDEAVGVSIPFAATSTEGKLGNMLLSENRRLREENKKLSGTCEKLMGMSNELNARLNKLSTWTLQGGVEEARGIDGMEKGPVRAKAGKPRSLHRTDFPPPSAQASSREASLSIAGRSAAVATSKADSQAPGSFLASARETQGQKNALNRLKSRTAASGVAALRQKVRNYNER